MLCVCFFTKFANDLWLVQRSLTKDYLRACSIFSSDGSILNSSREKERNAEKGPWKTITVSCLMPLHFPSEKKLREERGG